MSRRRLALVPALLAFAVLAMGEESCSTESSNGGDSADSSGPFADVDGRANCPEILAVGLPHEIQIKVKNTGSENWPTTFLTFDDGLDHFVFDLANLGPLVAESVDTPAFDSYRFGNGNGTGLKAGESGSIRVLLTPKEAGNLTLSFGVWGGDKDEQSVPSDLKVVECEDVAINP